MLVNFRVDNFLSIDSMLEFSMEAGQSRRHKAHLLVDQNHKLLKFSAIYGANASGKSSFIRAIASARDLVLRGAEDLGSSYNKNSKSNKDKETNFEFEIIIGGSVYSYGFSIILSRKEFVREWLYDITQGEKTMFVMNKPELEGGIGKDLIFDDDVRQRLNVYIEDSLREKHRLFLTSLNDGKQVIETKNGEKKFNDIYKWFEDCLEVLEPGETVSSSYPTILARGEEYKEDLRSYLDENDTGVIDVVLEPIESMTGVPAPIEMKLRELIIGDAELEKQNGHKNVAINATWKTNKHIFVLRYADETFAIFELKFKHRNGVLFTLSEESDGTVRLIELFSILYRIKEEQKVFVIDEIDRSLHPLLTYSFVENFLGKKCNDQLIVTAHEDILLDLRLLRRDEIWFVEKDNDGNSNLYSLEEFKERFDKDVQKAYHDGRYGGIPKLPNLYSLISEED